MLATSLIFFGGGLSSLSSLSLPSPRLKPGTLILRMVELEAAEFGLEGASNGGRSLTGPVESEKGLTGGEGDLGA